jgi:hypothetical protein
MNDASPMRKSRIKKATTPVPSLTKEGSLGEAKIVAF